MRGISLALFPLVIACGAKTGLYVPDADADLDAPLDAGLDAPDAFDADIPPPCIEVPRDGGTVRASLDLPVELAVVDVMFLLDATASMLDEIDTIRRRLRDRVVPGVREAIPDAAFGVALAGEFPVDPHGPGDVEPYDLRVPVTTDVLQVEAALDSLPSWGNFDEPEAQVEGLYQVATGAGLAPWINPSFGCASGGLGGGCFRRDSLPVILLITDAPMNNGPTDVRPISRYRASDFAPDPTPHTYDEAIAAVNSLGILVIGLGARDAFAMSPMSHLRAVSTATGAVDSDGSPLAFDIGGSGRGVGAGIVESIQRLAEGVPLDVDAIVEDEPGDAIDARDLVRSVRPLSARPADGVVGMTETTFLGARPGTEVTFELELDASSVPPSESDIVVPAAVLFRAFSRSRLARVPIEILIPGEGGGSCEDRLLP